MSRRARSGAARNHRASVQTTRVLVAEDSPLFVAWLRDCLAEEEGFVVVGVVSDGVAAVEDTARLAPDVILMDIHLPLLDGLGAIERIMEAHPTPVLVLTGDPRGASGELTFEALRRGALDLACKPARLEDPAARAALRQRVRSLRGVPVLRHLRARRAVWRAPPPEVARSVGVPTMVGIAASTGGPAALARLLTDLPASTPPILVVQHLAEGFVEGLRAWLSRVSTLTVVLARPGVRPVAGTVYLAPENLHLEVGSDGGLTLTEDGRGTGHRPSADRLFASLAKSHGASTAGLVLTGMGRDGAEGLLALRRAGGLTLAQDEASSVVWGMPGAAVACGAVRTTLPLSGLAEALASWGHRTGGQRRSP